MDISCVFFGTVFTLCGLLFALGKIHTRLPDWKKTPQEEKNRVDDVALCRNIGGMITLCGVIFLAKGFIPTFGGKGFVVAMIIWLIAAGVDLFYISKSDRYKK